MESYYKAKHTYAPENTDELSFKKGDVLKLIKKVDGAWWEGELVKNGTRGWFPSNYVRELKQAEIDKLKKDNKTLDQKTDKLTRQSRIFNDQKFRQVVLDEIIQNTTKFLVTVDYIINTIYPSIRADHQAYFNFKKLVQSLVAIVSVEKSLVSIIQASDRATIKLGFILLEKMDAMRAAFESYYAIHPATVESLRKDECASIDQVRSYLAAPLLRLENVPLKLRDLEKYYAEGDDDRLELGRAIYQVEQILQRCLEVRRRKELELSLLQQPILNWSGDSIDKLGTMRLMVQVSIRAGREQRTTSGYGLVFSSSVILITATDRMSGFVLITNLPTANASACRHNETTVELTGQSGHFWLDFEKESDAQEWWCSMQSLAIAKNRSSFTPYVASSASISGGETRLSRAETESSLGYQSMSKHAPVKLLPNSRASSTVPPNFTSGSPPPIKPSQSSTTLTSTASSTFCPRPTPPCHTTIATSTSTTRSTSRSRGDKRRPRSRARNQAATPDNELSKTKQRNDTEVLSLLRGYNENKDTHRPESQAPQAALHTTPQLTSEQLEEMMTPFLTPLRDEVTELRSKVANMESAMHTEKMKIRNMRTKLDDETKARKQLETHIVKWQQDHDEKSKND